MGQRDRSWIFWVVPLLIISWVFIKCSQSKPVYQLEQSVTGQYLTIEIGNMVYLPINKEGSVENNIEDIFKTVQAWEENNLEKEIISFQYVYKQEAYAISPYVYGVSLYWKPKGE
jgi:hypothetical protein